MPANGNQQPGAILWHDLTVPDAESVRDFYAGVVGWSPEAVAMDGYDDFNMNSAPGGDPAAGICHARGGNADLPPQWLAYVAVADLASSIARCRELGGSVVAGPKGGSSGDGVGDGAFCVIRDPAGAVLALLQVAAPAAPVAGEQTGP